MKCPEFNELLDLVENRLSSAPRARVDAHVRECSSCTETKAWVERTHQAMKSTQLYDAPEYAIQKAVGLLTPGKPALKEWILAKLNFDSWMAPAAAGTRSAASGPRQFQYQTETYSIHLMLDTVGKQARVTGQLVANDPAAVASNCLVEVADRKSVLRQVVTGNHGEFAFEAPGGRKLQLKIHGDPESVLLSCRF